MAISDHAGNISEAQSNIDIDFKAPRVVGLSSDLINLRPGVDVNLLMVISEELFIDSQGNYLAPILQWKGASLPFEVHPDDINPAFGNGSSFRYTATIPETTPTGNYTISNVGLKDLVGNTIDEILTSSLALTLEVDAVAPTVQILSSTVADALQNMNGNYPTPARAKLGDEIAIRFSVDDDKVLAEERIEICSSRTS